MCMMVKTKLSNQIKESAGPAMKPWQKQQPLRSSNHQILSSRDTADAPSATAIAHASQTRWLWLPCISAEYVDSTWEKGATEGRAKALGKNTSHSLCWEMLSCRVRSHPGSSCVPPHTLQREYAGETSDPVWRGPHSGADMKSRAWVGHLFPFPDTPSPTWTEISTIPSHLISSLPAWAARYFTEFISLWEVCPGVKAMLGTQMGMLWVKSRRKNYG